MTCHVIYLSILYCVMKSFFFLQKDLRSQPSSLLLNLFNARCIQRSMIVLELFWLDPKELTIHYFVEMLPLQSKCHILYLYSIQGNYNLQYIYVSLFSLVMIKFLHNPFRLLVFEKYSKIQNKNSFPTTFSARFFPLLRLLTIMTLGNN